MSLTPVPSTSVEVMPAGPPAGGPVSLRDELDMWADAMELAKVLAPTQFVPKDLRNNPPAVLACMLKGAELGVSALHALSQIHVIDGRPALAAELQRALILSHGHEVWVEESSGTRATICGRRAGSEHVQRVTWTIEDARRAKLDGKANWRNYPADMLLARATGRLARFMFADLLAGMSYNVEEVSDGFEFEALDPGPAGAAPAATTRRKAKKSAPRGAAPPPAALTGGSPPPLPDEEEPAVGAQSPAGPSPAPTPPGTARRASSAQGPGDPGTSGEPGEVVAKRAQVIAIQAREADVDHHDVVAAVTHGAKTSAKTLTAPEADAVLTALGRLRRGTADLVPGADGWEIVDRQADDTASAGDKVADYQERVRDLRDQQRDARSGGQQPLLDDEET